MCYSIYRKNKLHLLNLIFFLNYETNEHNRIYTLNCLDFHEYGLLTLWLSLLFVEFHAKFGTSGQGQLKFSAWIDEFQITEEIGTQCKFVMKFSFILSLTALGTL